MQLLEPLANHQAQPEEERQLRVAQISPGARPPRRRRPGPRRRRRGVPAGAGRVVPPPCGAGGRGAERRGVPRATRSPALGHARSDPRSGRITLHQIPHNLLPAQPVTFWTGRDANFRAMFVPGRSLVKSKWGSCVGAARERWRLGSRLRRTFNFGSGTSLLIVHGFRMVNLVRYRPLACFGRTAPVRPTARALMGCLGSTCRVDALAQRQGMIVYITDLMFKLVPTTLRATNPRMPVTFSRNIGA